MTTARGDGLISQVDLNTSNGEFKLNGVEVTATAAELNASAGNSVALTIPFPFTLDVRGGSASDGFVVGLPAAAAITSCQTEDNSATTFADETTDAGDAGAADVTLPDPFDTDDAIYLGRTTKFSLVKVVISTAGAGDAVTSEIAWEYYNGSAWAALTLVKDDSAGFTTGASTYYVSFLPPDDWATVAVNVVTPYYYVRMRATADDIWNTTQPVLTQALVAALGVNAGITVPVTGTITSASLNAHTASATNNDTELLLCRRDQTNSVNEFERVTWTKGDASDLVTGLDMDVVAGDLLNVQVLQEDGTTEFANASMILQIDVV